MYIGIIEVDEAVYTIIDKEDSLIACTACNSGLIEHEVFKKDDCFSLDENLQAFIEVLEQD